MVKCVYEKLIPGGQSLRRIVITQAFLFIILVMLCFEYELSLKFLSSLLLFGRRNFYPWAVRIILCSAMILFDALLLLYTFRIYKLYKFGLAIIRPVFPVDFALTLTVCLVCAAYIAGTIHAALTRNISMRLYLWLGRAFIQFSNFFYVPLEIAGAILLYKFYHAVLNNKAGEKSE